MAGTLTLAFIILAIFWPDILIGIFVVAAGCLVFFIGLMIVISLIRELNDNQGPRKRYK